MGLATFPSGRPAQAMIEGSTVPVTSPKPMRAPPAPGAVAVMVTVSPSSRKVRGSPLTVTGSAPPQVSSMNAPRCARSGPEIVPDANRSPLLVDAPFTVMCASICAGDQYMDAYGGRETTSPFHSTARSTSRPQSSVSRRYGSGRGSWPGSGTRAARSAAIGTTQGDTEVANDLPRCGPSGTYSQACRSLADQSLTRTAPNTWSANAPAGTGVPSGEPAPITKPSSASMSSRADGPNTGAASSGPLRWPDGRTILVPETTTVPARPW